MTGGPERHILFTTSWDDGHPGDRKIADMLEAYGFVGTFYASTGPDGHRRISDDDLTLIGARHELGVHGQTHTIFPELSRAALAEEIRWAVEDLSRFGRVGRVVAPPRGKIDAATTRFIGSLGFAVRTGAVIASRRPPREVIEPTFQLYPHPPENIIRNYAYRRAIPSAPLLLAIARSGARRDRFQEMLLTAARRGRDIHVWGHAADLERFDLWPLLERLLRTASELGLVPASNDEVLERLSHRTRST